MGFIVIFASHACTNKCCNHLHPHAGTVSCPFPRLLVTLGFIRVGNEGSSLEERGHRACVSAIERTSWWVTVLCIESDRTLTVRSHRRYCASVGTGRPRASWRLKSPCGCCTCWRKLSRCPMALTSQVTCQKPVLCRT